MGQPSGASRGANRNLFLRWFFVAGACAPAVWLGLGYALRPWSDSWGGFGVFGRTFAYVTFPTFVLFIDAEHLPQIIVMLVIAAVINGAWYVLVGLAIWHFREGVLRLRKT